MYCKECKKQFSEKYAFCPYCGAKQVKKSDTKNRKKSTQNESFLFGEYRVQIPKDAITGVNILKDMQEMAYQNRADYVNFYNQCNNIENVFTMSQNKILGYFEIMAEKVEKILLANNITGISIEKIIQHRQYDYKSFSILKDMKNEKEKLDESKNRELAYRKIRKNTRGRFVGGGFGLSGAVKGMAMAGAANMATGAMHNVFNVFGNASTKIAYNNRLNSLKDSGYCGKIANALEGDCFLFVDTLSYYLKNKSGKRLPYDMTSILESNNIIEQVERGKVQKQNEMKTLCDAFLAYPLNVKFYELFCFKYGDDKGELIRCMDYFGLDTGQVKLILASKAYSSSYFGDKYLPIIKNRLKTKDGSLEGLLYYFYDEEVNPFLLEDINNVPHLFIESSMEMLNNNAYAMAFKDCRNIHYIYQINRLTGYTIDLDQEIPLCLIRLRSFSMKHFIFITSKHVILPDMKIEILSVDDIKVLSDAVIFCNKYSVKQNMFYKDWEQEELLAALTSVILYIQFAYNLKQSEKTIPLLDEFTDNEKEDPYDFLKEDYMSAMAQYGHVSQYVASLFNNANWDLITIKTSAENMQYVKKELKKYQLDIQQEKFVLMYISEGLIKNKNGIYITEQNVYIHIEEMVQCLPLDQIYKFDYDRDKEIFIINGSITIKVMIDKRADELADHFMQIVKLLQMKAVGKLLESDIGDNNGRQDSAYEIEYTDLANGSSQEILEKVIKCCSIYNVSDIYDGDIAAGEYVGPESIKKYDEVERAFELSESDHIFFYYNDSTLFSGRQGLILCTSGMKVVSKKGKFFCDWDEFRKLNMRYSFLGDGFYINNRPFLPFNTEGKKTYKFLEDLQKTLNEA